MPTLLLFLKAFRQRCLDGNEVKALDGPCYPQLRRMKPHETHHSGILIEIIRRIAAREADVSLRFLHDRDKRIIHYAGQNLGEPKPVGGVGQAINVQPAVVRTEAVRAPSVDTCQSAEWRGCLVAALEVCDVVPSSSVPFVATRKARLDNCHVHTHSRARSLRVRYQDSLRFSRFFVKFT